jgi:hypothetical protein
MPQWMPRGRLTLPFGLAAVLITVLVVADRAWAPPAEGVPNMVVTQKCVVFGHGIQVGGFGFAPGSTVTLSAPQGHYTGGLGSTIYVQRVIANATGGFSGYLKAPPERGREPLFYEPRVIFATGTAQAGGGEGESFDQVLIGTKRVCTFLGARDPTGRTR